MAVARATHEALGWSPFRRHSCALLLLAFATVMAGCGGGADQSTSGGASVALAWDSSPSPNVVSYRIYYGTAPGTYSQPFGQGVNVGNATTYTVTGLSSATTYYFAATAIDSLGDESQFSNETSATTP